MLHSRQTNCTFARTQPPPAPLIQNDSPRAMDLRAVAWAHRLAYELTETGPLIGMIGAGILSRLAQVTTLSRLAASPVARFWSRGWGAQATAGLAGFAVEGAAFPIATRLATPASRHPQTMPGIGEALLSSYFFMGGLRVGGLAANTIGSFIGAQTVFSKTLLEQGGRLGGIHLGSVLEHASGWVPSSADSLSLTHSLTTLAQINLAGLFASQLLGARFAAWQDSIEQKIKFLSQGSPPSSSGTSLLGQDYALAGNGKMTSRNKVSWLEEERGPTQSLMSKRSGFDGLPEYDRSGIEFLRKLQYFKVPPDMPVDKAIRNWIEASPHPIAVARHESRLALPQIAMVNGHFKGTFQWQETLIRHKQVSEIIEGVRLSFILSRIRTGLAAVILGRYAEFDPTPMALKMGMGDALPCIGAGVYLPLGDAIYAFGIFTEIASKTSAGKTVSASPIFSRPPPGRASLYPSSIPPDFLPPEPLELPERSKLREGVKHFHKAFSFLKGAKGEDPDSK